MKRHASIWTCGALALCALLACAVSAAGLALGALLGLGIAVLGGPVRAGLWSNALQRPQAALVCGALLGSAWSAGEGGRVDAGSAWRWALRCWRRWALRSSGR